MLPSMEKNLQKQLTSNLSGQIQQHMPKEWMILLNLDKDKLWKSISKILIKIFK